MLKSEDCNGIKLLYVEDDLEARKSTLKIIKRFFNDIVVAVDGKDGLEKFKTNNIDIVITDIFMPNMDGIEMLGDIMKLNPKIYSIVLTANSDQGSFTKIIKLGVKSYIIKPMDVMQFVDTLEFAVEHINNIKQINILKQYKDIVDKSSIVSKSDSNGRIIFVNDKFCDISGYKREELIGKQHNIVRDPSTPKEVFDNLWSTVKNKKIWTGQIKNKAKDGHNYYVDSTICPIIDQNDNIIEYIGLRNDISEMINPKKQLLDTIKLSINPLLAIVKIDNFSTLEHLYNENIIDKLEERFEKRSLELIPEFCKFDKVFYLGDGEYAYFKNHNDDTTINATQKEIQLKKFQQNVDKEIFKVEGYDFDLSIIISFSTQKEKIFENVKYGLNKAVENKLDIIFSNNLIQESKAQVLKNQDTVKMIQKAINENQIVSYFQPITNNETMKIEKYESLVRLINDEGRVLSPFFFLEVAKESGYYSRITQIVIGNYFEALDKTDKEISLNLSAIDIEDLDIRNKLINLVMGNTHNAHRMVFELLEDEEVKDFEIVKDFISLVKAFGVQIAIDDFGAGVSNFERLLDYQPDILKIDACLIKNIDKDKYSRDVVETLQLFAWKQKIKTVAEFVETEEILQTVKDIGINYTQGYLLGKPEPLI
ncbi:MAG: EAL domain-containing protein [Campylobacterota bacterium]|nr:EAL domain-containing protein [Campylobacterota bacterium]